MRRARLEDGSGLGPCFALDAPGLGLQVAAVTREEQRRESKSKASFITFSISPVLSPGLVFSFALKGPFII